MCMHDTYTQHPKTTCTDYTHCTITHIMQQHTLCKSHCTQGKRYILPNTSVMLHHPSGTARGQASDIYNEARELMRLRDYVNNVLSIATGQPLERVCVCVGRGGVICVLCMCVYMCVMGRGMLCVDFIVVVCVCSPPNTRHAHESLDIHIVPSSTHQPPPQLQKELNRNKYLDPKGALEYGVIDQIVKPKRKEILGTYR